MNFRKYQLEAKITAIYPREYDIIYPTLGLAGEAGEVAEKIKKYLRKDGDLNKEDLTKELGDVLWYVANLAYDLGINLEDVAVTNLEKLRGRKIRGTLHGEGDNR